MLSLERRRRRMRTRKRNLEVEANKKTLHKLKRCRGPRLCSIEELCKAKTIVIKKFKSSFAKVCGKNAALALIFFINCADRKWDSFISINDV